MGSRVRLCALAVAATALPNTLVCSLVSDDDGDHGGAHMRMRGLPSILATAAKAAAAARNE